MEISPDTRIAMIYNPLPNFLGYGGYLERGLKQVCKTEHFVYGEETDGFDAYFYVDDGPTYYMEPRFRPATYFAIDMVVQPFWYLDPVAHYFERCQNFDHVCVSSTATLRYCQERGMDAKLVGFAADPEYHQPYEVERDLAWVAVWHNCGDRIAACDAARARFPSGQVLWAGDKLYSEWISRGRCALNWLRGDIVNMRVFEVMATGTPLITTRHADMDFYHLVEGQHYLGYTGVDEMIEQIAWANDNQDKALAMAKRARQFVLSNHTYLHRALEALNAIR